MADFLDRLDLLERIREINTERQTLTRARGAERTMKILLVEDCDTDAKAFVNQCASLGAGLEVITTALLSRARELCDAHDVLVVDLNLSDATSEQTMEFVRERRRKQPTIIYTTDDDPARIAEAGRIGAGYLIKGEYRPKQILVEIYRLDGRIQEWQSIKAIERALTDLLHRLEVIEQGIDATSGRGEAA